MTQLGPAPQTGVVEREYAEAMFKVFEEFALTDQRNFYKKKVRENETAGTEVNILRAVAAFVAGLASALAALLVALNLGTSGQCTIDDPAFVCQWLLPFLAITAVIAPAIGAAFTTIADLYQWDRLAQIYRYALESLVVADSLSPEPEDDNETYWLGVRAYAEGTLGVMSDESAQWGTLIRTPQQIQNFVQQSQERANQLNPDAFPIPMPDADTAPSTGTSASGTRPSSADFAPLRGQPGTGSSDAVVPPGGSILPPPG